MSSLDFSDVIRLENWPTSFEYRKKDLRGRDVLLSFSRGKDSIAAWFALLDAGARVHPFYLYLVPSREPDGTYTPGLKFEQESIAYYEKFFGTDILQMTSPSTWRYLRHYIYTAPQAGPILDAAKLQPLGYEELNQYARDHYGLPDDTWVVDGVRAADSPNRRTAMLRFGPHNHKLFKYRAVYDWRKKHVMDVINHHGCDLPIDYRLWGRTWDGIDLRFTAPMAEHLPDDFATLHHWFPLLTSDMFRARLRERYAVTTPRKVAV
jgi:hypothetical protein